MIELIGGFLTDGESFRYWFRTTLDVWGASEVTSIAAINVLMYHLLGYANFKPPTDSRWPHRLGAITVVVWLVLSLSHDGLHNSALVGSRLIQAIIYGWFANNFFGGVFGIYERFAAALSEALTKHRSVCEAARKAQLKELESERMAIQREARRLEELRLQEKQATQDRAEEYRRQLEDARRREQEERERPERERRQREAAARAAELKRIALEKKGKIAAIRYELELLYERCRPTLRDMPPERFFAYFDTHLTTDLGVEEYQNRAGKLKETILELADVKSESPVKFRDLEHVIEHFNTKKQRLKYLELDEDTLEVLLIAMDEERDKAIRDLL